MLVGLKRRAAHLRKQLAKALLGRDPHPHDQRIGKKTDQALQLHVLAVGDRRTDQNFFLAAVPRQQRRKG